MIGNSKRRRADSNRRIGVLQTPALPLGYTATLTKFTGAEDGIRTRDLFLGKEAFYR
jgi:hypothetical protein